MRGAHLLHAGAQLGIAQVHQRLLALGDEEFLMPEGILYVEQLFGTHALTSGREDARHGGKICLAKKEAAAQRSSRGRERTERQP